MLTFAIGDIHGCLDKLTELLDQCRRFAKGRPSTFIFLGDYIDRGPNSRGVVQTVLDMKVAEPNRVIALAGNHEDLLSLTDTSAGMGRWLANGGGATLRSYAVTSPKDLPADHVAFLRDLPTYHDDGRRLFVHAGVRPGIPLDQQTRDDLLWIREPFLSSPIDHGRLVIHDHMPTRDGKPNIRPNCINLDTGAVFGQTLTAAVFVVGERNPVAFLQA
jgi:serine/threonine protein phosphatase 1